MPHQPTHTHVQQRLLKQVLQLSLEVVDLHAVRYLGYEPCGIGAEELADVVEQLRNQVLLAQAVVAQVLPESFVPGLP